MDPIWGLLKAALLEVVWVQTDVFAPPEVEKLVPHSDLVLVCWVYFEVGDFHSEFMVALVVMVKLVSVAEICFFARCGKSDRSHFLLYHHSTIKEVSLGCLS